ncbi:MAG: CaiB/BaiF CoA transferase family protein [Dehalococcoidia bacterium]
MAPPLEGLRVLDLSTGIAGPYSTKILADYGARVVKVEQPSTGDQARREGPFPGDVPHPEKSGLFLFLNTGKEGVTLNMETITGRDLFHRLIGEVDVLVESFPPSRSEALGISYDELSEHNPELVLTSITDFGRDGPRRDHKLTDMAAFASTGFVYPMGEADRPPVRPGGPFAGFITGLYGCFATLMAYLEALATGQGQQVDVSMQEVILSAVIYDTTASSYSGQVRKRQGNWYHQDAGIGLSIQPTKDGHIGFLVGPGYERWRTLWEVLLGRPEVLEDERFETPEGMRENGRELEAIAQSVLKGQNSEELFHEAQALRLLFGQILTMKDLFHNKHLRARGYFQPVHHPELGQVELPGLPWRFSETPAENLKAAPTLGQHNRDVYSELLEMEPADLTRLGAAGII